MKKFYLSVPTLILTLALLETSGCGGNETARPNSQQSVAIAVNFDPTTELEPFVRPTENFSSPLTPEAKQAVFRNEANDVVVQRIVGRLQPSDVFYLSSVSGNSLQTGSPLSFELPQARNNKEKQKFLTTRNTGQQKVEKWFEVLGNYPPCPNPRIICSDIFNSIVASAQFLKKNQAPKAMLVFSDGQDNITRIKSLLPDSLSGVHVVFLYAYPPRKSPNDYEPFRRQLLQIFKAANPRSIRILFPVEARAFDFEEFIASLRRENQ